MGERSCLVLELATNCLEQGSSDLRLERQWNVELLIIERISEHEMPTFST